MLLGDLEEKGSFASLPFRIAVPGINWTDSFEIRTFIPEPLPRNYGSTSGKF